MCVKKKRLISILVLRLLKKQVTKEVFLSTPLNSFINNLKSQATNSISKAYKKALSWFLSSVAIP